MKIKIFLIVLILYNIFKSTQCQTLETRYGDYMSPKDTLFTLNIFINIIYDECDTGGCDPFEGQYTEYWQPGVPNSINSNPPSYLSNLIDSEFDPQDIKGVFTKRYAEASFNYFIILGDFIVVNITQSRIYPKRAADSSFGPATLVNSAIRLINDLGGLQTINNHNLLSDYDLTYVGDTNLFLPKGNLQNNNIDLAQFYIRNSTDKFGEVADGGKAGVSISTMLHFLNNDSCSFDGSTIQGVGKKDLSHPLHQPSEIHELAHYILGYINSAHMGGGSPVNVGNLVTLSHNTGGWSLIGSMNSSLISCNGFERWRLDWRGPNNQAYRIACLGINSDIAKPDGIKTFYLRDFVTTGDVVRITLPYIDSGALAQHIWLENHQIHNNGGKEDYPAWWEEDCRSDGTAGVYAYYQVGKDSLEGNSRTIPGGVGDMLPPLTDHLVPICAEGNWDISFTGDSTQMCINGHNQPIQQYDRENPLSGYNDLMEHFFDPGGGINTLDWADHATVLMTKKKNGVIHDSLSSSGDAFDAFRGNTSISIGTNPTPSSLVTYHHSRWNSGYINSYQYFTDNRKIHLSGLKIDFTEQANGIMKVDVRWDHYNIENSVLWTGDIVLHEELSLLSGKKITLDQNRTPNRHTRNTITGLFADPTYFTCLDNSEFTMQSGSEVEVKNLGSFLIENGGSMEIKENAKFIVDESSTILLEDGANLTIGGKGYIKIQNAAYLCVETGANIELTDLSSKIFMHYSALNGVNSSVLPSSYSCVSAPSSIPVTGLGRVIVDEHPQDAYIQNETINSTQTITTRNAYVGECVTTTKSFGDVIIESGSNVTVNASGEVFLDSGFEIEAGAVFTVL